MSIQTYRPTGGMVICLSGGEYVSVTDYLAEKARADAAERDAVELSSQAMRAFTGRVCTPVEGFRALPWHIKTCADELAKELAAARREIETLRYRLTSIKSLTLIPEVQQAARVALKANGANETSHCDRCDPSFTCWTCVSGCRHPVLPKEGGS